MIKDGFDEKEHSMRTIFLWYLLQLISCGLLFAQAADPFSPTVTRAESELIQKAMGMPDEQDGVELLQEEMSESSSAALYFSLGSLFFQMENYPEAAEAYEQAVGRYPGFRDAKINLGRVYVLLERPEESVRVFQELVRDGSADAETYLLLGHGLMMMNQSLSAETAYRQVLLLDQMNVDAKQGLLNCLLSQQRDADVLSLTDELLQQEVTRKAYWAARVNAQLSLGKSEEAASSIEQARRLGVADSEMLALLGQLYLDEIPEEAVIRLEESFAGGEISIQRRAQVVLGLLYLGRLRDAERFIDEMGSHLSSMPEAERAEMEGLMLKLNIRLALLQKRFDEAGDLVQKGLERNPLDGELLGMRAEILLEQGMEEESLIVLEQLARLPGFEAEALLKSAQIQADRGQWAFALQLVERAQVFEEKPQLQAYVQQLRRMAGE